MRFSGTRTWNWSIEYALKVQFIVLSTNARNNNNKSEKICIKSMAKSKLLSPYCKAPCRANAIVATGQQTARSTNKVVNCLQFINSTCSITSGFYHNTILLYLRPLNFSSASYRFFCIKLKASTYFLTDDRLEARVYGRVHVCVCACVSIQWYMRTHFCMFRFSWAHAFVYVSLQQRATILL